MIVNPEIEKYLESLHRFNDPVLEKMERLAQKLNFPIVGRQVGMFLYILTKQKKPSLVVELGSGFGYSGYWFAKGLDRGLVALIDYKEENINKAKDFFKEAGIQNRALFFTGDAVEVARQFQDIDILFLDLEKSRYLEAVEKLKNNLSEDALIIADNVLWHGKVVDENPDKKTKAIKEFNEYMFRNFNSVILPIRDGVLLAMKKSI